MDLTKLTITEIQKALKAKSFSAVELAEAYLGNIEKDKRFFLSVTRELALAQAKKVDDKLAQGGALDLLDGVPCVLKDDLLLRGVKCTAGSKMLKDYIAPYEATVVKKLKERGAIILGKTDLREFDIGDKSKAEGLDKMVEGSAGAVAEAMAAFALGSDNMGSVRVSAALHGLFGLKPTYGLVSRYGLISAVSSLSQVGILAKNGVDLATVLKVILGQDPLDSTTVGLEQEEEEIDFKDLRVGIPREYFVKNTDPLILKKIEEVIEKYQAAGVKFEEISLPHAEEALMCYHIIAAAEASAGLARYDGIRYGHTEASADDLLEVYTKSRGVGFGTEVKQKLILGTLVLSKEYYTDYYLRAQKIRTLLEEDFKKAFTKVAVIFTPTLPILSTKVKDEEGEELLNLFTVLANLVGLPALSFPVGEVEASPVGLQIIGKMFTENKLLKIAKYYDRNFNSNNP